MNDLLKVPQPDTRWRHRNGNEYRALLVANLHTEQPDEYPITVVYQGANDRIWSRPASEWHCSFTAIEETSAF